MPDAATMTEMFNGQQVVTPDLIQQEAGAIGYRSSAVCQRVGITYRQLDYWTRTGLVVPSIVYPVGSGNHRAWSAKDVLLLGIIKQLLDSGVSLNNVRPAVEYLHRCSVDDLANARLFHDGSAVYMHAAPQRQPPPTRCDTEQRAE